MSFHSLGNVEQRIDQNYNCIRELESLIPLQKTDEEKAKLISFIGKMYAEYITGQYASNELEQNIIEMGTKIAFRPSREPESGQILIVMSEACPVGGHTVLVHNWIKWDKENTYSIVFTKMERMAIPDFVKEAVQESGGDIFYVTGATLDKAQRLLEVSQKFERILLFTHMDDIIPVMAYSNKHWSIPVFLYNHADFRFSYGFSVADAVLNLCEFDADKTVRYRGICEADSIVFQFPGNGRIEKRRKKAEENEAKKRIREKYGVKEEKLIVSMGIDFKYESIIGYEFDAYVSELLNQSMAECNFLIIGADQKGEKWVRLKEKTQGKARALGILPREEAEQIISATDLYIVSFPMLASGQADAEDMGVPVLYLDIINRYADVEDIRAANSVSELIEKSLDVLYGNKDKYVHTTVSWCWTKQEWMHRLHKLYKQFDCHTVRSFCPVRRIEKQEYVNCQLMQRQASQSIYDYMFHHPLERQTEEELYRLDRKYEMGISYLYMDFLKKRCGELEGLSAARLKLSEKHLQLYLLSLKWLKSNRKGQRIGEYLCNQGCRTVAIYGMGHMGQSLAEELSESLLENVYGIDRNASRICAVVPVYAPLDKFERADIIINTTMIENEAIMNGLGIKDAEMMMFGELLDMMDEG